MRLLIPVLMLAGSVTALHGQQAQLTNPGFEEAANNLPAGWGKAIHGEGFRLSRDTEEAHTGDASARLDGDPGASDRSCFLQTSAAFAPPKAVRLSFWYRGTGKSTGILRFRPVAGVEVEGDQYGTFDFTNELPTDEWTERVYETILPKSAREAEQVQAEIILYQRGAGTVWYDDVSVALLTDWQPLWREAESSLQCPWRPADGRTVLQSPPDFSWTPQQGAVSYEWQLSQDEAFPEGAIETVSCPYNVYSHRSMLEPGAWHWRVRFTMDDGEASRWSPTHGFTVPAETIPFPVPPAEELLASVPESHPRVLATQETLDAFRARRDGPAAEWWEGFERACETHLAAEIDLEPGPEFDQRSREGPLTDEAVANMQKLRSAASRATGRLHSLAFAYLVTGDAKYAEAAIARMVEMASWDPDGVTSYRNHDQVFRDITWKMAVAYDWCHGAMSEEQRGTVLQAVETRAAVLYRDFTEDARPLHAWPYDSHGWTAIGFLGIVATALAHDSEQADEWFQYVAAVYPPLLPPWGDEEGGWSQGTAYWKWSTTFAFWYFDALKSATGLDLYQKAWSRNNGWYKLYTHPPFNDRHHFGDGNHGPPGDSDRLNLARWAAVHQNPYFQWYADALGGNRDGSYHGYYWYDDELEARPPADLPQARHFPDIGWVAMHSALHDPDDVMLVMKSSPYGSFNHSHADQNHFVLYAYGEPLLIDSGYYDWYGSPHDTQWTRQTKAHNCVLVNGEGQPIFNKDATGEIVAFESSPEWDYACGDAMAAYMGKLERFRRHVVFLRPDIFVIVDDISAPEPAKFTWCLHAEEEMLLDEAGGTVDLSRGKAKLRARFLQPSGLTMRQDDDFGPEPAGDRAKEWHAYVETTEAATTQRFVTLLLPYRAEEELQEPEITVDSGDEGLRIEIKRPGGPATAITFVLADGVLDGEVETLVLGGVADAGPDALKGAAGAFSISGPGGPAELRSMRAWTGEALHWGTLQLEPGPYIAACAGEGRASVSGAAAVDGEWVWVGDGATCSATVPSGKTLECELEPLAIGAPMPAKELGQTPEGIRWEAETYIDHGGGTARAYSHREFLSGGQGVETQVVGGVWLKWRVDVPETGRYYLALKGATHEENADRLLEVDGEPLGGDYRVFRFPYTGGYGAVPEEWKDLAVCGEDGEPLAVELSAGTHELRMTLVQRKLNLDYLVLARVE